MRSESIVTYMCDYRRGLDWRLDLLTTYRSELQVTITLSPISSLYKSLQHTLKLFSLLCFTSRSLVTTSNIGDSLIAPSKYSLHIFPYDWLTSKLVSVITSGLGPRRKHRSLLYTNRFCGELVCLRRHYSVTAACTCLVSICCLAANVSLFISRPLPSNQSTR
jgi:hypothetical protein